MIRIEIIVVLFYINLSNRISFVSLIYLLLLKKKILIFDHKQINGKRHKIF